MNRISIQVLSAVLITLSACSSVKEVGRVNMISTRNVDSSFDYERLGSFVELTKRQKKKSRNETISAAINSTVQSVPGGEFIMNARVYLIDGKYFAVEGDIWGSKSKEYRGYEIGDVVQWSTVTGKKRGVITGFANKEEFMVQEDGEDFSDKVKIEKLNKVSGSSDANPPSGR
ncbi:MAG: hypothetical protein WA958_20090 [Tunicatimonas sp.]